MTTGPYNSPHALGREPFAAAFWVLCAPLLFLVIGAVVLESIWPDFALAFSDSLPEPEQVRIIWTGSAIISLLHFALLTQWCSQIGAGAFAGSMRASPNWIIAAILFGPPIILIPNLVMKTIVGGETGWEFSNGFNEALFSPKGLGPAYFALALLLAPLVEEITFRGVGIGALVVRGVPPLMSSVITSAAWTLLHSQYTVPALCAVFLAGLALAWLRLKSGTVLVPILAHIAANSVVTFLASLAPPSAG